MTKFELPTTPEAMYALEERRNDDDRRVKQAMIAVGAGSFCTVAAASRLLERERCVEALAKSDACPILWSSEGTDERRREWARRILGVAE